MRSAAGARALARRAYSAQPGGGGAPPASQLAQHKLNLTQAERAAGASARAEAEARAAEYARRRLRSQQPAEAPEPFTTPESARAPLDDDGDSRRAFLAEPPPEGGLAGIAEQIKAAQREGAFDNLRLRGAPLEAVLDPHEATHFGSDTGGAIAARVLRAANYRPASLELRAELEAARPAALAELASAAAAALRSHGGDQRAAAAALRCDARLLRVWAALDATVKAYNGAALADRETFGALFPAHPRRAFDFEADARDAVAAAATRAGQAEP